MPPSPNNPSGQGPKPEIHTVNNDIPELTNEQLVDLFGQVDQKMTTAAGELQTTQGTLHQSVTASRPAEFDERAGNQGITGKRIDNLFRETQRNLGQQPEREIYLTQEGQDFSPANPTPRTPNQKKEETPGVSSGQEERQGQVLRRWTPGSLAKKALAYLKKENSGVISPVKKTEVETSPILNREQGRTPEIRGGDTIPGVTSMFPPSDLNKKVPSPVYPETPIGHEIQFLNTEQPEAAQVLEKATDNSLKLKNFSRAILASRDLEAFFGILRHIDTLHFKGGGSISTQEFQHNLRNIVSEGVDGGVENPLPVILGKIDRSEVAKALGIEEIAEVPGFRDHVLDLVTKAIKEQTVDALSQRAQAEEVPSNLTNINLEGIGVAQERYVNTIPLTEKRQAGTDIGNVRPGDDKDEDFVSTYSFEEDNLARTVAASPERHSHAAHRGRPRQNRLLGAFGSFGKAVKKGMEIVSDKVDRFVDETEKQANLFAKKADENIETAVKAMTGTKLRGWFGTKKKSASSWEGSRFDFDTEPEDTQSPEAKTAKKERSPSERLKGVTSFLAEKKAALREKGTSVLNKIGDVFNSEEVIKIEEHATKARHVILHNLKRFHAGYESLPLSKKLLLSGALIGAGVAATVTGSAALGGLAAGGGMLLRAFGAATLGNAGGEFLRKSLERKLQPGHVLSKNHERMILGSQLALGTAAMLLGEWVTQNGEVIREYVGKGASLVTDALGFGNTDLTSVSPSIEQVTQINSTPGTERIFDDAFAYEKQGDTTFSSSPIPESPAATPEPTVTAAEAPASAAIPTPQEVTATPTTTPATTPERAANLWGVSPVHEVIAKKGQTLIGLLLSDGIQDAFPEQIRQLTEQGRQNLVLNIVNHLTPEQLKEIGILGGNEHILRAGTKIDITKLAEIAKDMTMTGPDGRTISLIERALQIK